MQGWVVTDEPRVSLSRGLPTIQRRLVSWPRPGCSDDVFRFLHEL